MTNNKFVVIDHQYINTGGNTMVSIFTVYDKPENVTRYVICDDTIVNIQTADTVTNSDFTLDNDEMIDKIVLDSFNWDILVSNPCWDQRQFDDDAFELYKYCQFEHLKKDCKYFSYRKTLSIYELPNELFFSLTDHYIQWAKANDECVKTDGYQVFMNESYTPPVEEVDEEKQEVDDYREWLRHFDYEECADVKYISIRVGHKRLKIPFHADNYDALCGFLDDVIERW